MPSRQRKWQLKMRAQDRCMKCGANAHLKPNGEYSNHCLPHLKERNRQEAERRQKRANKTDAT